MTENQDFIGDHYKIIKNFIEYDFVEFIQDYFTLKINASDPNIFLDTYDFCYDPLTEVILQNSCEVLGEIIKINILPTYSFVKMYMKGDKLQYNFNKNSSEIIGLLSLGVSEDFRIDSIYLKDVENKFNSIKINLDPGDLCLFDSRYLLNSGEVCKNKWNLQCFLHFVEQTSPNRNLIYDGRPYLGFNSNKDINNEEFK